MISINVDNGLWKYYSGVKTHLWIKGNIYSHAIESIIKTCDCVNQNEIQSFIKSLDGHFAIIVQTKDLTFIATDKIRSTPLFL